MKKLYSSCILLAITSCLSVVSINASELCKSYNRNWKKSFSDLREKTIAAASLLEVVNVNGEISVKGENRSDILVRACVRTWSESKSEAKRMADGIRVEMGQKIFVTNTPKRDWSVSFNIIAPKSTGLNLKTKNGRIKIESISGDLDFETTNGSIGLNEVSGSVKFETTNGSVRLNDVSGNLKGFTQNGSIRIKLRGGNRKVDSLDVGTINGNIRLTVPRNYAANIEAETTNGSFRSDFSELRVGNKRRWKRQRKLSASINGGGTKVRLVTNNGGIRVLASKKGTE